MKLVIVIVVIVILLQAATLGIGLSGGGMGKPTTDEIKDGWDPKEKVPEASFLGNVLDPFRPRLDLPWENGTFGAETQQVAFGNGHADGRVAKFELAAGTGVRIHYGCVRAVPPRECTQTVCLCRPGFLNPQAMAGCDEQECAATGEIVVYSVSGTLEFTGIGDEGGTVTQQ